MTLAIPDFLDTKTYAARTLRRSLQTAGIQPGIANTPVGTFNVTQRAAGANMTLDVAAGIAWVAGSDTPVQGYYNVINDAAVVGGSVGGVSIPAAHATLPRIDQVYLQVRDSTAGSAGDDARFVVVQGTPTSGATLNNRNGANAVAPASSLRLCDVLVPAAATTIVNANIAKRAPNSNGFKSLWDGDHNLSIPAAGSVPISAYFDITKPCDVQINANTMVSAAPGAAANVLFIEEIRVNGVKVWPNSSYGTASASTTGAPGWNMYRAQKQVTVPLAEGRHLVEYVVFSQPTSGVWSFSGRQTMTCQAMV